MDTDGCHGVLPIIIRVISGCILQADTCPELQVDTNLDILQAGTCPGLQVDTSLDILQAGTCLELQVDTNMEILLSLIQACSGAVPGCNFLHPGTAPEIII